VKNAPGKRSGELLERNKVEHNREACWIKTSTYKIQAWNGAQYVKKCSRNTKNKAKLGGPWKRPNSKFLA